MVIFFLLVLLSNVIVHKTRAVTVYFMFVHTILLYASDKIVVLTGYIGAMFLLCSSSVHSMALVCSCSSISTTKSPQLTKTKYLNSPAVCRIYELRQEGCEKVV